MRLSNPLIRSGTAAISLIALLAVLLVASTATASEQPRLPNLSPEQIAKLEAGEIIVEVEEAEDLNRGLIVGIIQDPINKVVPYVARCWEYAPWRDNIRDTRLEQRIDDETIVCSGVAETPRPARDRTGHFRVHNHITQVDGERAFVSTFNYLEDSGNMEDMFGYWVLTPYGKNNEHTLLTHVLNVDMGGWIPGFLIRWATRNTLPATVWGIRKQLNDGTRSEPLYWNAYDYNGQ